MLDTFALIIRRIFVIKVAVDFNLPRNRFHRIIRFSASWTAKIAKPPVVGVWPSVTPKSFELTNVTKRASRTKKFFYDISRDRVELLSHSQLEGFCKHILLRQIRKFSRQKNSSQWDAQQQVRAIRVVDSCFMARGFILLTEQAHNFELFFRLPFVSFIRGRLICIFCLAANFGDTISLCKVLRKQQQLLDSWSCGAKWLAKLARDTLKFPSRCLIIIIQRLSVSRMICIWLKFRWNSLELSYAC